jgi:hypothetical protein
MYSKTFQSICLHSLLIVPTYPWENFVGLFLAHFWKWIACTFYKLISTLSILVNQMHFHLFWWLCSLHSHLLTLQFEKFYSRMRLSIIFTFFCIKNQLTCTYVHALEKNELQNISLQIKELWESYATHICIYTWTHFIG